MIKYDKRLSWLTLFVSLSWDMGLLLPWTQSLIETYTIGFLASQVFGLGWNYTIGSPGSSTC